MDRPFDASLWVPSKPWEPGETQCDRETIAALIKLLNWETTNISQHPYDPTSWIRRAWTLSCLRYPELAAGDAHKATVLCRNLLADLGEKPHYRLGSRCGFWMKDDDNLDETGFDKERGRQQEYTATKQCEAHDILSQNLYFFPNLEEGRCVLRPYPWLREEHTARTDDLLDTLDREFADPHNRSGDEVACVVKRYAFGKGVGARDGADLLGVFACRNIPKEEVVVIDRSRTWGCNGPGKDGTSNNLFGALGCLDELHPNSPTDDVSQDIRWIRDRCGKRAADAIVKCKFLSCSVNDGAAHPLDHCLIARLTPTYSLDKIRVFSLEHDIAVLDDALQQFGIDIFTNLKYDTWVFFVLMARIENNCWSDPNTACVSSLFSMFNHSCEPTVNWQIPEDHVTMNMTTSRDIKEGEQLFVCYDGFMTKEPVHVRRKRFNRWLDCPCQCSRCMREEAEQQENALSLNASFSSSCSSGDWDTDEKPTLPEDEINYEHSLLRTQDLDV